MPVDELQARVIKALAANRSPGSSAAGGFAPQQHGWRLSNDIDVFDDDRTAVPEIVLRDISSLGGAGFGVELTKRFEGLSEAVVARESEGPEQMEGSTLVQWVRYSGENFFAPIADETFGYRLSFIDLAVNKALAAASRRQRRDLLDLRLVASVLPLWNVICAASGKDASLTPLEALNEIRRNATYSKSQLDEAAILPEGMDASHFAMRVRGMLDKAEAALSLLPRGAAGSLLLGPAGGALKEVPVALGAGDVRIVKATRG